MTTPFTTHGRTRQTYFENATPRPSADYKEIHTLVFRQLYVLHAYKAETEGTGSTEVDPAYTSKRCLNCGTPLDENYTSQANICCQI
ncbi:hypothetical protein DJ76_01735 [Halorubrum ezzemoulense]|uniref:Cas12f1-like TNB domain-containing protein n=1 Tax=Halorubrum ezzemoulense TaxID=337243 RepID=A0A256K450_HALEZ|nr:hypothetical protein DJ76_01735 [Halorubrum ezzemoulense]